MSTLDYYNQNAETYIAGTINADVTALYSHFEPLLKPAASILDLGCGSGRDSKYFLEKGFNVTAVDGSVEFCKRASEYLGVPARQLLFEDLDYESVFDAVWACASLLHVPKDDLLSVLEKVGLAMKPSGILYASFKYGTEERKVGGRLFSDFTEEDIPWLTEANPEFSLVKSWLSGDVRDERAGEKWLNIIWRKDG